MSYRDRSSYTEVKYIIQKYDEELVGWVDDYVLGDIIKISEHVATEELKATRKKYPENEYRLTLKIQTTITCIMT